MRVPLMPGHIVEEGVVVALVAVEVVLDPTVLEDTSVAVGVADMVVVVLVRIVDRCSVFVATTVTVVVPPSVVEVTVAVS